MKTVKLNLHVNLKYVTFINQACSGPYLGIIAPRFFCMDLALLILYCQELELTFLQCGPCT